MHLKVVDKKIPLKFQNILRILKNYNPEFRLLWTAQNRRASQLNAIKQ
jgi:hypothetical protein